jgi:hypothetical protein
MAGKIIQIAKSVAANTLTVAAASGQLVNGAASVAYTAINSTGVFQSDGSNWYVFQTVGDATTLNTYAADTGTTAGTIPVRDENGDLPGDITGNAATADSATSATTATKVTFRGALVYNNTSTSSGVPIDFLSAAYDTDAIHESVANPERLTVPSGVEFIRLTANVVFSQGTESCNLYIQNNTGVYVGRAIVQHIDAGAYANSFNITTAVIPVAGGDYFLLRPSGATVPANDNGYDTWFAMEIIE